MMLQFETSPNSEKRRVTSSSDMRGAMPVTKRLEPSLLAWLSALSLGAASLLRVL